MAIEARLGEVAELVEGAPLLRAYTSKGYRGFESLPLRHLFLSHNFSIYQHHSQIDGAFEAPPANTPVRGSSAKRLNRRAPAGPSSLTSKITTPST